MAPSLDPYTILGVPRSATESEIRSAYRKAMRIVHPDKVTEDQYNKEKVFEVQKALEILADPSRRAAYDSANSLRQPQYSGWRNHRRPPSKQRPPSHEYERCPPNPRKIRKHDRSRVFCERCNVSFSCEAEYAEHVEMSAYHHFCPYKNLHPWSHYDFETREQLLKHFKDSPAHGYCEKCDEEFQGKTQLRNHWLNSETHIFCTTCDMSFDDKNGFRTHVAISNKHWYCKLCDFEFETRDEFVYHLSLGHVHCTDCSEEFPNESVLDFHSKLHHGNRYCGLCGIIFSSKEDRQLHANNMPRHFPCARCDMILPSQHNLFIHWHTSDHAFCKTCRLLPFETPQQLQDHMRESKNHFWCAKCNEDFASDVARVMHIKYSTNHCWCSICEKEFDTDRSLTTHYETKHRWCSRCSINLNDYEYLQDQYGSMENVENTEYLFCSTCAAEIESEGL